MEPDGTLDPATEPTLRMGPSSFPAEDLSSEWVLRACGTVDLEGAKRPALGRYAILARIGRGGMGVVYYGWNPRLDVGVAIKTLPRDLEERQPGLAERFLREARLAARLRSPHLVGVLDVDRDEAAGVHYLVMEYVRGLSAREWMHGFRKSGASGAPEDLALELVRAATKGLEAAHVEGIVHRDVKPDNILIPYGGSGRPDVAAAKLSDLGLARADEGERSLTGTDVALGTPGYMAPEQARDVKRAKKPADVFGMGATLYALLAGEAPFAAENAMESLLATVEGRYRRIEEARPDVSRATARLLARCLDPDPSGRFPDASALLEGIEVCRRALAQGGCTDPDLCERIERLVKRKEVGKCVIGEVFRGGRRRLLVLAPMAAVACLLLVVSFSATFEGTSAPAFEAESARGTDLAAGWAPPPDDEALPSVEMLSKDRIVVIDGVAPGAESVSAKGISAKPQPDGRFEIPLPLEEGIHDVVVTARDETGDHAIDRRRILVDLTPPGLELEASGDPARTRDPRATLRGRVSDAWLDELTVDGRPVAIEDGRFETQVDLAPGSNRIEVRATDQAGNENRLSLTVFRDDQGPSLELDNPPPARTREIRIRIRGRVGDPSGASLEIAGIAVALPEDGRFEADLALAEGANAVRLVASDELGNLTERVHDVFVDRREPEISLETPAEGDCLAENPLVVKGRVADDSSVRVSIEDSEVPVVEGRFERTIDLEPGANRVRVVAVDEVGNERKLDRRVHLDLEPPRLEIASPPDRAVVPGPEVLVSGRVLDEHPSHVEIGGRRFEVERDGSFRAAATLPDGPGTFVVEAYDRAGRAAREISRRVEVDSRPPAVEVDPLPDVFGAGPATIRGSVDEDGCRVDLGGTQARVEGRRWEVELEVEGDRTLEVVAADRAGNTGRQPVEIRPLLEIGTVEDLDASWNLVVVSLAAGSKVALEDVLVVRGKGPTAVHVRVKKIMERHEDGSPREISARAEEEGRAGELEKGDQVYRRTGG